MSLNDCKNNREFSTREIRDSDIKKIVGIHVRAFPGYFLTSLGPRFLELFYQSFVKSEEGAGIVAVNRIGEVVGVVVGPLEPSGYFKRLLLNKWASFCFASLKAVVLKPSVMPRLFRAIFYRGDSVQRLDSMALLSSIAVAPELHGKGVGKLLVNDWLSSVRVSGVIGVYLTTDAIGNEDTNHFYKRMGWVLESQFVTKEGRHMNRYVFSFSKEKTDND